MSSAYPIEDAFDIPRRGVIVLLRGLPADLEVPTQVGLKLIRPGRPPLSCSGSVELCSFPEGRGKLAILIHDLEKSELTPEASVEVETDAA